VAWSLRFAIGNERQFLAPDTRDFFYLTTR
jgi:hypothetical protein